MGWKHGSVRGAEVCSRYETMAANQGQRVNPAIPRRRVDCPSCASPFPRAGVPVESAYRLAGHGLSLVVVHASVLSRRLVRALDMAKVSLNPTMRAFLRLRAMSPQSLHRTGLKTHVTHQVLNSAQRPAVQSRENAHLGPGRHHARRVPSGNHHGVPSLFPRLFIR